MDPMTITAAALAALQLALKLRAIAQQNGEWTPEQEAKFRSDTEAAFKAPHWQKS
jgi:hypothetical protein